MGKYMCVSESFSLNTSDEGEERTMCYGTKMESGMCKEKERGEAIATPGLREAY